MQCGGVFVKFFLKYAVLVFRDQQLEPADLMRVGARFGEPCHYPFVSGIDGFPFIFEVVKEESETVNFGGNWHSDTTYLAQPPLATLLYALETPKHGGDTLSPIRRRLRSALRRDAGDSGQTGRREQREPQGDRRPPQDALDDRRHEGAGHRESRRVRGRAPGGADAPGTGRKALYLSRSHTIRFRDMTEQESRPLIDFLQAHQIRPEFTCRVRWSPGTLTIWDNRCTQHCAVNDYHGQRRRMRRLTVGA